MQCHMEAWERVKYIIENEGYNKNSFSNEIGLRNNATIGRLINEHRTPSGSTVDRIIARFPKYNRDWLITGEGDIYASVSNVVPISPDHIIYVPLVNQYAYAGYMCGYADVEYIDSTKGVVMF